MAANRNITTPCESVSTLCGLGNRPLSIGVYILGMKRMLRTRLTKSSGIYQIQSKVNGKTYVGSTVNIKRRVLEGHKNDLKKGKHINTYLQRHYNKYGVNDLIFGILEFCPKEKLIEREQYYIDTLKPVFNLRKIADSNLGVKWSEESKKRSSIAKTGKKNPAYGIPKTEKQKEAIRKRHIGKIVSEETREKLRLVQKNRKPISEETRRKMSKASKGRIPWNKGKFSSEETKRKVGLASKKRMTPEMKKHLSDCQKGRKRIPIGGPHSKKYKYIVNK